MGKKKLLTTTSIKIKKIQGGSFNLGLSTVDRVSLFSSLYQPAFSAEIRFNDRTDIINREKILAGDKVEVRVKDEISGKSLSLKLQITNISSQFGAKTEKSGMHSFIIIKAIQEDSIKLITQKALLSFGKEPKGIDEILKKIYPDIKIETKPSNKIHTFITHPTWTKIKAVNSLLSMAVSPHSQKGNDFLFFQDILKDQKVYLKSLTQLKRKSPVNSEHYILGDKNTMYKYNILDFKLNKKTHGDTVRSMRFNNLETTFVAYDFDNKKIEKKEQKTDSKLKDQFKNLKNDKDKIVEPRTMMDKTMLQKTGGELLLSEESRALDILTLGSMNDSQFISLGNIIKIRFVDKFEKGKKRENLDGNWIVTHLSLHLMPSRGLSRTKARLYKIES